VCYKGDLIFGSMVRVVFFLGQPRPMQPESFCWRRRTGLDFACQNLLHSRGRLGAFPNRTQSSDDAPYHVPQEAVGNQLNANEVHRRHPVHSFDLPLLVLSRRNSLRVVGAVCFRGFVARRVVAHICCVNRYAASAQSGIKREIHVPVESRNRMSCFLESQPSRRKMKQLTHLRTTTLAEMIVRSVVMSSN
jgi:hypothetical protein